MYNNNNEPRKEDVGAKRTISYPKIDDQKKIYNKNHKTKQNKGILRSEISETLGSGILQSEISKII